jgi:hypothetical protein
VLALWRGIGLEELCERLLPVGQERIAWAKMAAVLVAARFCEPSSELHIAKDWYRRTALCHLLQLGDEEITKDRLYRGLDHLLAHKAALEAHLSRDFTLIRLSRESRGGRAQSVHRAGGQWRLLTKQRTVREKQQWVLWVAADHTSTGVV